MSIGQGREIRFRAWVKNDNGNYMSPVGGIDFNTNNIMVYVPKPTADGDVDWDGDAVDGENIILMQYTGLKDKNGKEIYEGDIINPAKAKYKDYRIIKWESVEDLEESYTGFDIYPSYTKKFEVVGNIYENPELIKEASNGG